MASDNRKEREREESATGRKEHPQKYEETKKREKKEIDTDSVVAQPYAIPFAAPFSFSRYCALSLATALEGLNQQRCNQADHVATHLVRLSAQLRALNRTHRLSECSFKQSDRWSQ